MVKSVLKSLGSRSRGGFLRPRGAGLDDAGAGVNRLTLLDDFEESALGWLWALDADGRLAYLSHSAGECLGRAVADLVGQPFVALFEVDCEGDEGGSRRPLSFQLGARARLADLTVRFTGGDAAGAPVWWLVSATPKFDADGAFLGYRGCARDITVEHQRKLEDSRAAEHDSLTGLYNRHHMDKRLDAMLAAFRAARRSCAVMMLDLDRFKQVNDSMGHKGGDELLRMVADRLRRVIGEGAEIGRLGGDEFQIVLPDMDDRGKLGDLAQRVIQMVSQPYAIEGKRAIIGTSIGIAVAPYDGIDRAEVVHAADLALYASKNAGRGQFRFYSSDLRTVEDERRLLMDDLRAALAAGELELHYQPVVRAADNLVVAVEALMRWEHPERGTVSPAVFIPAAEESNLINQLGEWALRRACEDALAWPDTVRVAVNVSALQFANPGFPSVVTHALAASGLDPTRLELELTESVFMGDGDAVDQTFRILKDLGVRLALDDFGTGYSSLSYLRSAPFDKIKVDKSFVDSCTAKDQNSAKIIAAIIGLSNALGMDTVVEGVEAFDQLELVRSKGAQLIQGWLYSRALRPEVVSERFASGAFRIVPDGPDKYRSERRTVFKRIGVIHEDCRYDAVMRDLSRTGARIEGLVGVPAGTGLVLDLGAGQLVVCSVIRSQDAMFAVEFETPLVSDGAGGLCTRHRVSPYALAAAGMPLASLPKGDYPLSLAPPGVQAQPRFLQVAVGARG